MDPCSVHVRVEESAGLSHAPAGRPRCGSTRCASGCYRTGRRWAACSLTVAALLLLLCWLIPALIAQSLGMLAVYFVMPRVMIYVYPTRLGMVHVLVFRLLHRLMTGGKPHSRSVRVECVADGAAWPYEDDAPEEGWLALDTAAVESPLSGAAPAETPPTPPTSPPPGSVLVESEPSGASSSAGSTRDGALAAYAVHTIAILLDNYCYVIVDLPGDDEATPLACALVDPADAAAVLSALAQLSRECYGGRVLRPSAILTTHKHWDHAAGNRALKTVFGPSLRVYGGAEDFVDGCTHPLRDGDTLRVGRLRVTALAAPGHTVGSVAYMVRGAPCTLFGGDVLFCGGCGAPFEGTAAQMCLTFAKLWRACPTGSLLFPGHEYTLSVLPQYIGGGLPMPESADAFATICAAIWRAKELRAQAPPCPTVPLALADELRINDKFAPLRRAAEVLVMAWRLHQALEEQEGGAAPGGGELVPAEEGEVCVPCEGSAGGAAAGGGAGTEMAPLRPAGAVRRQGCGGASGASALVGDAGAASPGGGFPSCTLGLSGLGPCDEARELVLVPRGKLRRLAVSILALESHAILARRLGSILKSPIEGGILGMAEAEAIAAAAQEAAADEAAPDDDSLLGVAAAAAAGGGGGGAVGGGASTGNGRRSRGVGGPLKLITSREVAEAFTFLGFSPDQMRARTLLRAVTSRHLLEAPLSEEEGLAFVRAAGADHRGVVSRSRLEARLGVPPPPPPPKAGRWLVVRIWLRLCPGLASNWLRNHDALMRWWRGRRVGGGGEKAEGAAAAAGGGGAGDGVAKAAREGEAQVLLALGLTA